MTWMQVCSGDQGFVCSVGTYLYRWANSGFHHLGLALRRPLWGVSACFRFLHKGREFNWHDVIDHLLQVLCVNKTCQCLSTCNCHRRLCRTYLFGRANGGLRLLVFHDHDRGSLGRSSNSRPTLWLSFCSGCVRRVFFGSLCAISDELSRYAGSFFSSKCDVSVH